MVTTRCTLLHALNPWFDAVEARSSAAMDLDKTLQMTAGPLYAFR